MTVHLLDLPDQVNTDLVKEGDKLDLQVNTKNTDLVRKRRTNLISRFKKSH